MDIEREVVRLRRQVRFMAILLLAGIAYLLVSELNGPGRQEIGGVSSSLTTSEFRVKKLQVEELEVVDSKGVVGAKLLSLLGGGVLLLGRRPESLSKEKTEELRSFFKPLALKGGEYLTLSGGGLTFAGEDSDSTSLRNGWLSFTKTSEDGKTESTRLSNGSLLFDEVSKDGKKEFTKLRNRALLFAEVSKDGMKESTGLVNGLLTINEVTKDGKKTETSLSKGLLTINEVTKDGKKKEAILANGLLRFSRPGEKGSAALVTSLAVKGIDTPRLRTEDVLLTKLDGSLPALAGRIGIHDGRGRFFLWDAKVKGEGGSHLALGPDFVQMSVKDPKLESPQFLIMDSKSEIGGVFIKLLSKDEGSNTGPALVVRDEHWNRATILKAARAHWIDSGIGKGLRYPNVDSLLPLKK